MKPRHRCIIVLAAAVLFTLAPSAWAGARKYKILHNFGSSSDGAAPYGPPTRDEQGNLYGTTVAGGGSGCGGNGCGTVFQLTPKGNGKWGEQILYAFTDTGHGYAFPEGNLVRADSGNLYGFAKSDYCCYTAIFELSPGSGGWNFSPIWTQGASPGLLMDGVGNLYGAMGYHAGPVAELSLGTDGWTYTDLCDSCSPSAPLSWDSHGNLYGTQLIGGNGPPKCPGSGGCGYAFQVAPNGDGTWTCHVLYRFANFPTDGYYPYAGLTIDASGTAYGVTSAGGKYDNGTFFKLTLQADGRWKETILYQFPNCNDGCGPLNTLVFDKTGALYGSAAGGSTACGYTCGVVFKFSPQKNGTWKYSVVRKFNSSDGAFPYGVVLDSKGNIFGTTQAGGTYGGGVAFEITP